MEDLFAKACKKSYNGGRSKVALWLDLIFVNLLKFAAASLILRAAVHSSALRIFIAAVITAILAISSNIIEQYKYKRHISRLYDKTKRELRTKKLLCISPECLRKAVSPVSSGKSVIIQKSAPVDSDDIYAIIREENVLNDSELTVFSVSDYSFGAQEAAARFGGMKLLNIQDIPEAMRLVPISDEEIKDEIIRNASARPRRQFSFKDAVKPDRARKYLLLGIGLYLLSFFIRYRIYMRICASLALFAAGIVVIIDEKRKREIKS